MKNGWQQYEHDRYEIMLDCDFYSLDCHEFINHFNYSQINLPSREPWLFLQAEENRNQSFKLHQPTMFTVQMFILKHKYRIGNRQ